MENNNNIDNEKEINSFNHRFNLKEGTIINDDHIDPDHVTYRIWDKDNLKTVILKCKLYFFL